MNVLIATINIYSSLPPRRNATRLFTRVLQLSTHRFTKRNEREREGKRKKNSTLIFHGLFPPIRDGRAWTLSSISHDWYSIHRPKQISIRRIGQQSRGSLLDYDPFSMEGKRYGRIFTESMSCRTRPHWRETGASIGITVDAGVIISNRSCLAGPRARAIYFFARQDR